jgi:hypothetical protein
MTRSMPDEAAADLDERTAAEFVRQHHYAASRASTRKYQRIATAITSRGKR